MNNLLIEYSGSKVRILQADSKRITFIDQLEFVDSDFFYLEPKINFKKVNEFSDMLAAHLKKNNLSADSLKLVLDSRLAYISCIPIDFSDEPENINSSLIWELSNFYPESYKNYKINFQKINTESDGISILGNTLVIACHKNIAEVTRRISEISKLKITSINFDLFTAGNYICNYLGLGSFVSVGCKRDRVDVSFYIKGKISFFLPLLIKEDFQNVLLNEVNKVLSLPGFEEVSEICFYGDETTVNVFNQFESFNNGYKLKITDPFEQYNLDPAFLEDRVDKLYSYSFTSLFGLM